MCSAITLDSAHFLWLGAQVSDLSHVLLRHIFDWSINKLCQRADTKLSSVGALPGPSGRANYWLRSWESHSSDVQYLFEAGAIVLAPAARAFVNFDLVQATIWPCSIILAATSHLGAAAAANAPTIVTCGMSTPTSPQDCCQHRLNRAGVVQA